MAGDVPETRLLRQGGEVHVSQNGGSLRRPSSTMMLKAGARGKGPLALRNTQFDKKYLKDPPPCNSNIKDSLGYLRVLSFSNSLPLLQGEWSSQLRCMKRGLC